ncbi:hypothetical protein K3148_06030 [Qipengyuania aurantiaca]|uniref:Surface antigen domain-containing protein n=1 Tax=Qipengyuania aurantiaca TaxID=2867233 RepID=A0ABX8ZPS8_9SPHN|nr:hypothetical protein [Qipengyuania aurantiaca]QZD90939.1 hypothetical protein K3148_06030 [Qipengyuania aurantiaca]
MSAETDLAKDPDPPSETGPAGDPSALDRGVIYSPRELAAMERRERLSGWLLLSLAGAAVVAGIFFFRTFSEDIALNDDFVPIDRGEPEAEPDEPFVWGQPRATPTSQETASPVAASTPATRRAGEAEEVATATPEFEEREFNFPGPPELPAVPTFAGPPAGTVDRETARALRTGLTQPWSERGQRGYVLVSKAVAYGSRECRQISYTRFQEDGQASSPSTQWCRIGTDGKWRKDARGPE